MRGIILPFTVLLIYFFLYFIIIIINIVLGGERLGGLGAEKMEDLDKGNTFKILISLN